MTCLYLQLINYHMFKLIALMNIVPDHSSLFNYFLLHTKVTRTEPVYSTLSFLNCVCVHSLFLLWYMYLHL
jgi:hypothetical protein